MKRAAWNIFDQLVRIQEKDGFVAIGLTLRDFSHDVGYVCEFTALFFGFFEFLFIFCGLYKEIGFGVFGPIRKKRVN
jgi:hypothetical protein